MSRYPAERSWSLMGTDIQGLVLVPSLARSSMTVAKIRLPWVTPGNGKVAETMALRRYYCKSMDGHGEHLVVRVGREKRWGRKRGSVFVFIFQINSVLVVDPVGKPNGILVNQS